MLWSWFINQALSEPPFRLLLLTASVSQRKKSASMTLQLPPNRLAIGQLLEEGVV